ncbi:MAG: chorismate mutase [Chloroflexi bacterium]|nr:chorismate mutase [Chloroflexota bacterium]
MACRGVRGATTVARDEREELLSAATELLLQMAEVNGILPDDLAAVLFTCTPDLLAAFPAEAARRLGWRHVPLLDAQEMAVPGTLPRCLRILMLWNTDMPAQGIRHVYLREAQRLRPDLAVGATSVDGEGEASGHRDEARS